MRQNATPRDLWFSLPACIIGQEDTLVKFPRLSRASRPSWRLLVVMSPVGSTPCRFDAHSAAHAAQQAWRTYCLRKKLALKLLEREDPVALLTCHRFLRGSEGADVRASLDRLGARLRVKDEALSETLEPCVVHEACTFAYDAIASRFALPTLDERYVAHAFGIAGQ